MPAATPPDSAVDREFATLARKLRLARGFCFIVLFVGDARAGLHLRTRLAAWFEVQGRTLTSLSPTPAAKLVYQSLNGIFGAAERTRERQQPEAVWLEAFRGAGDAEWDEQRRLLLTRLNERRSRLEAELAAPLVLLLPEGAQRDAASLAPDLWHVRLHSATLTTADDGVSGRDERLLSAPRPKAVADPAAATTTPPEVAYWESQLARGLEESGYDALDALSLDDGHKAVEALQRLGQTARAAEAAATLRLIAWNRLRHTDPANPAARDTALFALAMALKSEADVLMRAGRREEGLTLLEEALQLVRPELDSGNASEQALVALQLLQQQLGHFQVDAGEYALAADSFAEALRLNEETSGRSRTSALLYEAARGSLLQGRGDALFAAGRFDEAIASYAAGVASWRAAVTARRGDFRRHLALALVRLGDAQWRVRQGERSVGTYREALGLLVQVQREQPEEADGLDTIGALLATLGHVEQESGRVAEAVEAYDDGLAIARRLVDSRGRDEAADLIARLALPVQRIAVARQSRDGDDELAKLATTLHTAIQAALDDPSRSVDLLDAATATVAHLRQLSDARK